MVGGIRCERFTVEDGTAAPAFEEELLRIPHQREQASPSSCDLAFGPGGDLFLATADNAAPDADGYAPLDERSPTTDAQGTAADTSDLRGKVLRITPEDDGTYSVPEDNMFTAANGYAEAVEAGTVRPEIYAMGIRNPRQISVDPATGAVQVGDRGPSAQDWNDDRGPIGISEYTRITEPGNYGWPYVRGPGYAYREYDYESGESGDLFDPAGPTNDSPNNDGLEQLPAVAEPTAYVPTDWDSYTSTDGDSGQSTPAGPVPGTGDGGNGYSGDVWNPPSEPTYPELTGTETFAGPGLSAADGRAEAALPAYLDGKWLLAGADTRTLRTAVTDDAGEVFEISPFLPEGHLPDGLQAIEAGPRGRLFYAAEGEEGGVYQLAHNTADVQLVGRFGGWQGVSPDSIEGQTNPTLAIEEGTHVRLEWTNGDGGVHNFQVLDDSGEALVSTPLMGGRGNTQVVEFVATTEMTAYQCNPHSGTMNGTIEVSSSVDGVGTLPYTDLY